RRKYRHARRLKYRRVGIEKRTNRFWYRCSIQSLSGVFFLRSRSAGRGITVLPGETTTSSDFQAQAYARLPARCTGPFPCPSASQRRTAACAAAWSATVSCLYRVRVRRCRRTVRSNATRNAPITASSPAASASLKSRFTSGSWREPVGGRGRESRGGRRAGRGGAAEPRGGEGPGRGGEGRGAGGAPEPGG